MAEVDSLNGQPRADDRGATTTRTLQLRADRRRPRLEREASRRREERASSSFRSSASPSWLRDLYINGRGRLDARGDLGSSSLDDIIARLDAIERVSSQDAQILRTVKRVPQGSRDAPRQRSQKARTESGADRRRIRRCGQAVASSRRLAEQNRLLVFGQGRDRPDAGGRGAAGGARSTPLGARQRAGCSLAQPGAAGRPPTRRARPAATPDVRPEPPARHATDSVVPIALQYLGVPYVWGALEPVDRIRLLRLRELRLRAGRDLPCPTTRRRSTAMRDSRLPYDQLRARLTSSSSAASATWGSTSAAVSSYHAPHTGDVVQDRRASPTTARASALAGSRPRSPTSSHPARRRHTARRRALPRSPPQKCSWTARRLSLSVGSDLARPPS